MASIETVQEEAVAKVPVVLVVDDNEMARTLLSFIVAEHGFEVRTAANGWEAVDVYTKEPIDLVLLDVVMPGMDGPKVFEILKTRNPQVCCCFATAGTGSYSDQDLIARGAAWVFKKPFSAPEIGQVIKKLLLGASKCIPAAAR
jgi:CheY-like chemotaxis protein